MGETQKIPFWRVPLRSGPLQSQWPAQGCGILSLHDVPKNCTARPGRTRKRKNQTSRSRTKVGWRGTRALTGRDGGFAGYAGPACFGIWLTSPALEFWPERLIRPLACGQSATYLLLRNVSFSTFQTMPSSFMDRPVAPLKATNCDLMRCPIAVATRLPAGATPIQGRSRPLALMPFPQSAASHRLAADRRSPPLQPARQGPPWRGPANRDQGTDQPPSPPSRTLREPCP